MTPPRTSYLPEPDFTHTPEAKQRRLDKAEQLATFMVDTRIQHRPDEPSRRDIERAAGVRRCSDETWTLAIGIWQQQTAAPKLVGRDLTKLLGDWRFAHINEYDLQAGIEEVLRTTPWQVTREHPLDAHNRLDFLVETCGIEVKVEGPNTAVERQLRRYATFADVRELVLVTTRMRHLQLPEDVGCPLYIVAIPGVL